TLFDRDGNGSLDGFIDFNTERAKLSDRNLGLIDNSTSFHDLADSWAPADPSVQLLRMVGADIPTIETVVEYQKEECSGFLWWRNCHMAEKSAFAYGNGDGTVPLHSADLYDPTRGFNNTGGAPDVYALGVKHADLPTQDFTLAYAVSWLSGARSTARRTLASGAIGTDPGALAGTEILVNGPVYGLISDTNGNRLGTPDAGSEVELNEIPGAVFNRTTDSGSYFVTLDGSYQSSWTATADGQVQLL